jgi:hypothetical protein
MSLILGFLICAAPPAHEFHVSKTNIRYVADREQVQVEMHLFLDDLEIALRQAGAPDLYIGTEDELPQTGELIARYLEKNFQLTWNGIPLPTGLLGYEMSDDLQALWIYLAADTKSAPNSVRVQQTALTELYDDQRNVIKIFAGTKSTTLLTSRDKPVVKYDFK